jgi:hypothetical protein
MDPKSKAIISWRTGKRGAGAAKDFARDPASRVEGQVQITSDQLQGYKYAIPGAFGDRVDYAQEHKKFGKIKVEGHEWMKFRVDPLVGVEREAITGAPDLQTSTVCHMERFFLTMRQGNKRTTRKTLAYSKDWDNHALMSSIFIFIYNMVRRHESGNASRGARRGRQALDVRGRGGDDGCHCYCPTPKDKLPLPWYLDMSRDAPPDESEGGKDKLDSPSRTWRLLAVGWD